MKILVIRFSSIGDIVLTTPIIRALQHQLDEAEIHFCTKAAYYPLLEANIYLRRVHLLEKGFFQLIRDLNKEDYDRIIDLHHNLRSFLIKMMLGKRSYSFPKLNVLKWLAVRFKINRLPNIHLVDRYFRAVEPIGVKKDGQGLDYFIPDKDEVEKTWLPDTHKDEYVVYALGGKYKTKQLPVKRMIELCDMINKPVILLGGKEDFESGEEICRFFERTEQSKPFEESLEKLNKKALIFNACGKFNLNQSASIIKGAKVVFSHDTGMMHIAAAFHKKIYSIWGNTIPEFGMYPYKTPFVIFENKKLGCRPCSKLGFKKCPKGHFKCMNDLVFDFYIP